MDKRQLSLLFASNLVPFAAGNTMFALMPIYVSRLGDDTVAAGYNLSISYVAIALGLLLGAGWPTGSNIESSSSR